MSPSAIDVLQRNLILSLECSEFPNVGLCADPTKPNLLTSDVKFYHLSPYPGTEFHSVQLSKEGLDELALILMRGRFPSSVTKTSRVSDLTAESHAILNHQDPQPTRDLAPSTSTLCQ